MKRSVLPCLLAWSVTVQPVHAQNALDDPHLQYALSAQWELYQEVPINRVPFLGAHNSFSNRSYSLNSAGKAMFGLAIVPLFNVYAIGIYPLLIGIDNPGSSGSVLRNQSLSFNEMLDAGVRSFELDVHYDSDTKLLRLCHAKVEDCEHSHESGVAGFVKGFLTNPVYNFYGAIDNFAAWLKWPQYQHQLLNLTLENFAGTTGGDFDDPVRAQLTFTALERQFGTLLFTPGDLYQWRASHGFANENGFACSANQMQGHFPTVREVLQMGKRVIIQSNHYDELAPGLQETVFYRACTGQQNVINGVNYNVIAFPRFPTPNVEEFINDMDCLCNPDRLVPDNYLLNTSNNPVPPALCGSGACKPLPVPPVLNPNVPPATRQYCAGGYSSSWFNRQLESPAIGSYGEQPHRLAQTYTNPYGVTVNLGVGVCRAGREWNLNKRLFLQSINGDEERFCPFPAFSNLCIGFPFEPRVGDSQPLKIDRDRAKFLSLFNAPVTNGDFVSTNVGRGTVWSFPTKPDPINQSGSNRCITIDREGKFRSEECNNFYRGVCKNAAAEFDGQTFYLGAHGTALLFRANGCGDVGSKFDPPRTPDQQQKVITLLFENNVDKAWVGWDACGAQGCFSDTPTQALQVNLAGAGGDQFLNLRSGSTADACVFRRDASTNSYGMECYPAGGGNVPVLRYYGPSGASPWYGTDPDNRRFVDINGDGKADVCILAKARRFPQLPTPADVTSVSCFLVVATGAGSPAFTLKPLAPVPAAGYSLAPPPALDVKLLLSEWVSTAQSGPNRDFCNVWFLSTGRVNDVNPQGLIELACTAVQFAADGSITSITPRPSVTYRHKFDVGTYRLATADVYAAAFTDVNGDAVTDFCAVIVQNYEVGSGPGDSTNGPSQRQNVCLAGSSRGFQINNLVFSEVYEDGLQMARELTFNGRWIDFNGDKLADLCLITIGTPSDKPTEQFPVVKCEPAYKTPTGKALFRSAPVPGNIFKKAAETFYLAPGGPAIAYDQLSFSPNAQYLGKFNDPNNRPLHFTLHAGYFNGDAGADFCVVGSNTSGDYVSCMFSEPGIVTLPAVASVLSLAPGKYGKEALLKGPVRTVLDNFGDRATNRTFINFNGDKTTDYCVGGNGQSKCVGYFN